MKISEKIDMLYATESVSRRYIAKSMFWVCIFVAPVFIYGTIINIVELDYFSAVIEVLFAILLFSGFPLIFKKKIDLFSSMFIYASLGVGFSIGVISSTPSPYTAYVSFLFLIPSLTSMALLGHSVRQPVIAGILAIVSILYSYFAKVVPYVRAEGAGNETVSMMLTAPLLMTMIVVILLTMVVYSTKNIVGKLSLSENESLERVKALTALFDSVKETINISEELNTTAETSLSLTGTISGNLASMEKSIDKLQRQIDSTQKIHESIDKAGQVVRESSDTQSSAVEQSASAVEEMASSIVEMSKTAESRRHLIDQLVEIEKDVSGQIQKGQKSFDAVKKQAGEMLNVVSVITDISDRTNLLAMNAAIEAAHAGNSGRGFAVVAQEIRKLAVEAGTNSQKIKNIIESSIKGIDAAVETNSRVSGEFHAVSHQIQEIDIALSDIITGFSELASGTNEITKVVENLAVINNSVQSSVREVTDQLSKGRQSVDHISAATNEIKDNMKEIAGDSVSIQNEAQNIYKIGQNNVKQIRILEEQLV